MGCVDFYLQNIPGCSRVHKKPSKMYHEGRKSSTAYLAFSITNNVLDHEYRRFWALFAAFFRADTKFKQELFASIRISYEKLHTTLSICDFSFFTYFLQFFSKDNTGAQKKSPLKGIKLSKNQLASCKKILLVFSKHVIFKNFHRIKVR